MLSCDIYLILAYRPLFVTNVFFFGDICFGAGVCLQVEEAWWYYEGVLMANANRCLLAEDSSSKFAASYIKVGFVCFSCRAAVYSSIR